MFSSPFTFLFPFFHTLNDSASFLCLVLARDHHLHGAHLFSPSLSLRQFQMMDEDLSAVGTKNRLLANDDKFDALTISKVRLLLTQAHMLLTTLSRRTFPFQRNTVLFWSLNKVPQTEQ